MAQTFVVIGGGLGIGRATVRELAQSGAKVIAVGRDGSKLENLNPAVVRYECDIADSAGVRALAQRIKEQEGVPDALIVTAGIQSPSRSLESITEEIFMELLSINLVGLFNLFKEFVPLLKLAPAGHFIVVSSVAGSAPSPGGGPAYAACKHGVVGMINTLRADPALRRIRFSVVSPGPTNTPFLRHRAEPVAESIKEKMLTPEVVARALAFVAALPYPAYVEELKIQPADF